MTPPELAVMGFILGAGAEQRGRHACGFAGWQPDGTVLLRKENEQFTKSGLLQDFDKSRNMIGHTRYATVGAQTASNAHPFEYKHIIGAHNGGIYNHRDIAKKYEHRKHFEVDSQHLIAHIAEFQDYTELTGYGAVSWLDLYEPGVVYLCRMASGELEAERLADGGIVWASTREILSKGLGAVGRYGSSKSMTFEAGVVYRVEDGSITKTDDVIEFGSATGGKSWKEIEKEEEENEYAAAWKEALGGGGHGGKKKKRSKIYVIGKPVSSDTGSTGVASAPPSDKSNKYAPVHAALEHYERGRAYGSTSGGYIPVRRALDRCPDKTLDLDVAIGLLYWLTDEDFELVQLSCDSFSRRQRRKYQSIANNILMHKVVCACGGCATLKLLVIEMLTPEDELHDPAEGCS